MDPLTWEYPDLTPYQYSGNDPIANIDLDGLEPKNVVKKLLGSLSDQGINASSKLLEKEANAGKWLVSWIDKGGVAQLKMFASKSASALSTALNIGAKVADVGLDFVPIAGGARDIYRGVRDGNWVQAGIGALSIVADIFTFGGSSVAKGIIKNAVKEGIEATTKKTVKEVVEKNGSTLANRIGQKMHKLYKADEVLDGVRIKEFRLPSGKRIDFIDFEKRIIYELKPNNPRAIKQGRQQLEKYKQEVEDLYGKGFKTVLETY